MYLERIVGTSDHELKPLTSSWPNELKLQEIEEDDEDKDTEDDLDDDEYYDDDDDEYYDDEDDFDDEDYDDEEEDDYDEDDEEKDKVKLINLLPITSNIKWHKLTYFKQTIFISFISLRFFTNVYPTFFSIFFFRQLSFLLKYKIKFDKRNDLEIFKLLYIFPRRKQRLPQQQLLQQPRPPPQLLDLKLILTLHITTQEMSMKPTNKQNAALKNTTEQRFPR